MTRLWQAAATLALLAVAELLGVIGVVAVARPQVFLDQWDQLLWLAQPPAWVAVAVWLGRRAGRTAQRAGLLAAGATAAALGYGLFLSLGGHGHLAPAWQWLVVRVEPSELMVPPAGLTLLAVGLAVRDRRRHRRAADFD